MPEEFAYKPVYAFVSPQNYMLATKLKWVINALYLAEEKGISKNNIADIESVDDESVRNLLGENSEVWQNLGLKPDWVRNAITDVGNMGEIYERNLGQKSRYKFKRGDASLLKDGGKVYPKEFK